MGCASSVPAEGRVNQNAADAKEVPAKQKGVALPGATDAPGEIKAGTETVEDTKTKARSKNSRARRLSYVANAEGVGPQPALGGDAAAAPATDKPRAAPVNVIASSAAAPAASDKPRAPAQSSNTRARRLSYVTNDPNVKPQPEEDGGESVSSPAVTTTGVSNVQSATGVTCTMACMSRAGREPGFKKQNQDNCFAFEKYITNEQSLFGAFDGHGPNGHLVSGYVKQHLPIMLVNHLSMENDASKALSKGFLEVDKALGSSRIDCEFSGSTSVVSFLKGKTLTTAWVGDSRGVMGRTKKGGGYEAVPLTKDHKPTAPEEKARIVATNGRVERLVDEMGQPIGPFRVWLQYAWIPGLAMSRALGDAVAHSVGVTSEPECTVKELTPVDKFMILASDGVWEFIESQDAVDIVGNCETVEEGCRQLVDEAYQRWLVEEEGVVDDITAVVVKFIHAEA
ncbi:TPA: hypothetical protein ACH3X2_003716 [Trebouxia sp. C0005]|nr:MAG: phosphatase 2C containing [Trebouxia sp. A1-2]